MKTTENLKVPEDSPEYIELEQETVAIGVPKTAVEVQVIASIPQGDRLIKVSRTLTAMELVEAKNLWEEGPTYALVDDEDISGYEM